MDIKGIKIFKVQKELTLFLLSRGMILKELQKNVASEAKHQRLMKVKLKDVEFHTDKNNA